MNKTLTVLIASLFASTAFATGKHWDKQDDITIKNNLSGKAFSESKAIAHGGTGIGGVGFAEGGSIKAGAVQNRMQGGNTTISDVGNTNFNNPRQTPMAYAPPVYSANPCTKGYSAGGSGAPFGFSLGFQMSDDECNARADSIRWQELQMATVACHRMLIDSDENQEALKAAGIDCNAAKSVAVAMPTNQIIPVATPALDNYVTNKELENKLDNAHRIGVMK